MIAASPTPASTVGLAEPPATRFAFFGRVSTDDVQDPSLSIPRQLGVCEDAIRPAGGEIASYYWDIESGRKDLSERGNGADPAAFKVPVPRDGGLADLLSAAANGRPFDAVIVESIDRLSRMTADGTRIERDLELLDVPLFAADEPMVTNATAILTRRVKQGVAEWYVRDLIEKSRRGMEESVRQGWHTGGPVPYGYALEAHPHPNPHKAREGKHKHKLVTDPDRAPIVLMIFEDYCVHHRGLGEICDKLNRDLDRYPPPRRNRKDEMPLRQTWSRSQLRSLLRNPKYTGYNVWNRHDKRKGRPLIRPRSEWVWSPTPTHEAIVPRELFDQVEERAHRNKIAAKTPTTARPYHGAPVRKGRTYVLRGRVRCGMCGRRMEGSHQKHKNWYRCQYVTRRGPVAADVAGHPRVLGIKEETILDALTSSASASSAPIAFACCALSWPKRPPLHGKTTTPSLTALAASKARCSAASTGKPSDWRSTTTPIIRSSRSPPAASKNWQPARNQSRRRSAPCALNVPRAPGQTRSPPCSTRSPICAMRSTKPTRAS